MVYDKNFMVEVPIEASTPLTDEPLSSYCPFIADVPITSYAQPFPIPSPDSTSQIELERHKKELQKYMHSKKFDPPLPLKDFCLIAKERWEHEDSDDSECSFGLCLLL